MDDERLPPLPAAVAEIRLAVRASLATVAAEAAATATPAPAVIVALSGGADSLALAAATAFEAPKLGIRAIAVVVDHGLQYASMDVAATAARQAEGLGLEARVVRVDVGAGAGPEASARDARYRALEAEADAFGASAILLGHTLDDQAETVLLGLARGSGAASLQGMAPASGRRIRPMLSVRRATTAAFCAASGLTPWQDPHNLEDRFARVRVRERVLPVLEAELGPGVAEALARTAEQLREDTEAFEQMINETIEDIVEHAEAGIAISVPALAANPPAIRQRVIRHVVASEFGVSLSRTHTLEIARLVTDWRGQGPLHVPGCEVRRVGSRIEFTAS